MKKVLLILLLFISINCLSQEKYIYSCASWGSKLECVLYLSFPSDKNVNIKDCYVKDKEGNVMTFKHEIEFVNYLSSRGWELMQVLYTPDSFAGKYRYYFKKKTSDFTPEELEKIIKK